MFFHMQISSKDKNSLKQFLRLISKLELPNLVIHCFTKGQIKKFVTVLKSPNVNKTAQEQFEFRTFSRKLFIGTLRSVKFLYVLKKIKSVSFAGINIKIKCVFEEKKNLKNLGRILSPDTLNLNFFHTPNNFFFKRKYVQSLDHYGEYCAKILLS